MTAFVLFVLSLGLFPVIGQSLFPKSEKPMFLVNIETPAATNLDETDRVTARVEKMLDWGAAHRRRRDEHRSRQPADLLQRCTTGLFRRTAPKIFVQLNVPDDNIKQSTILRLRKETADVPVPA